MKSSIVKALGHLESESLYLILKILGTPKVLDLIRYLNRCSSTLREEFLSQVETVIRTNDLASETDLARLEVEIRGLKIRFSQLKASLSVQDLDYLDDKHSNSIR